MKIAYVFAKAQTFFDFTSLRQGQFLANIVKSHKKSKAKNILTQGYMETPLLRRCVP